MSSTVTEPMMNSSYSGVVHFIEEQRILEISSADMSSAFERPIREKKSYSPQMELDLYEHTVIIVKVFYGPRNIDERSVEISGLVFPTCV